MVDFKPTGLAFFEDMEIVDVAKPYWILNRLQRKTIVSVEDGGKIYAIPFSTKEKALEFAKKHGFEDATPELQPGVVVS